MSISLPEKATFTTCVPIHPQKGQHCFPAGLVIGGGGGEIKKLFGWPFEIDNAIASTNNNRHHFRCPATIQTCTRCKKIVNVDDTINKKLL